jgi:hypothetical protein
MSEALVLVSRRSTAAAILAAAAVTLLVPSSQGATTAGLVFRQDGDAIRGLATVGAARFGTSVALSADATTALVGGPDDDGRKGAAWVFTRSAGGNWTPQGGKLLQANPAPQDYFGRSVALSADGNTALVGSERMDADGLAWVFTRSGSTWTRGPRLTPAGETGDSTFGSGVALSADGRTALIGGYSDSSGRGAAWVFTRSGDVWSQQGPKLTGIDEAGAGGFGSSVALSADGNLALIGGPFDNWAGPFVTSGAAWLFTRSGNTWSQFGPKLLPGGPISSSWFGWSVALSGDGNTALVGGPHDATGEDGAAWVYRRTGNVWGQQGPKLFPSDAKVGNVTKHVGQSVALSADGDTALIGGPGVNFSRGAIWIYTRTGTSWSQQGARIEAGGMIGGGGLGSSARLAADGHSAFVGALFDNTGVGAAWWFANRATVTTISPVSGPIRGGTQVTIVGTDFKQAANVHFGETPASSFTVASPTTVTAISPPHAPGVVDIAVVNSGGISLPSAATKFTYVDQEPPSAPGAFRARYARRALTFSWRASEDDVGVDHYSLERGDAALRRLNAGVTSTTLRPFSTSRKTVFSLSALDAAGNRSQPAKLTVAPKRRPSGVPRSIPRWAQKLFTWETTGRKGRRPATPKPLAAWYARWKAWQLQPYRITS